METVRAWFVKPDPQEQLRKCNALIRTNIRKLDREIANLKQAEAKAKNYIIAADRRAKQNPARQAQAAKDARDFARELLRTRAAGRRMVMSKAQLDSVRMQVNEAFAMRKIEKSIKTGVGVMKDINALVKLPQLAGTMQELSLELMKAGIIEEMATESLPEAFGGNGELEDEEFLDEEEAEANGEIDRILSEVLKDRFASAQQLPTTQPIAQRPTPAEAVSAPAAVRQAPIAAQAQAQTSTPQQQAPWAAEDDDEEVEDVEEVMGMMRNRLEALRN